MTREQKIARAQRLRDEGLLLREIAEEMGLSGTRAAWRLVNPERVHEQELARNAYKRQWEKEAPRGNCEDCGDELGIDSARRGHRTCRTCYELRRAEVVDERARRIVEWWAEGLTLKEIATKLGWTLGHIAQEFDRLREKGYDLPYRYRTGVRNATKFPDQVAA
jgi:hypothetical protein